MMVARRWLAGSAALALAGCASLFVSSPPANLYRLTSVSDYPAYLPHVSGQLVIALPLAPAGINTNRIALSKAPTSLDYYADAEWIDSVAPLLENLLLASFENTGAITAIDSGAAGLRADFMLRTEIRHFEAVYNGGSGAPYVWVEMIARLVAMPQRTIVAQARFQRSLPAAANSVPAVVAAFNAATKATLRDIVLWTLNNPALLHARR
jgi:cholesterol transport system auxiliary component